ncbi:PEP-CTERM sorting domain-containing protein [Pacificimonas sp. WHA3]|uniref:PEP-CTERM sorting domain-containing protein n=1 Tax=Pacificimonas pallii TaxID=2827236 RepID=A0ABS6SCR6_9SPHN|nr:PEP-CTERM sorting domain-containing protein [Pacificimonas pallii]MBV7256174.1 PEP-CTERM sorting domain-containing protein [Pacificimonas pallii]
MKLITISIAASAALFATTAMAAPIAIINGASQTSESGTTASITTQLTTLHEAAGNTVTLFDMVPGDLSGFSQVWDIRFSSATAITGAQETQYLNYLANGGGMFVMGENSNFAARNSSVLSLIAAAGGGALGFTVPSSAQTVIAPFTGPAPVTSVSFSAPGGVNGVGSGDWITRNADGTAGTGVAWGVGDLSNALDGALTAIFDVNFMQTTASEPEQNLTRNLIGFIEDQVDPDPDPVPAPAALALFGLGLLGLRAARRRKA